MANMSKNQYYINFTSQQLLGAKELLKSMPIFYNRVYFCGKYGNVLWNGETNEHFENVALLCKDTDITNLRQIIKNNFLHIQGWDSLKFTNKGDYGFSFICGNIKFILMPFTETNDGYTIRYYDVNTYECFDIVTSNNKSYFLTTSVSPQGEFIRLCDFNIEDINENNSTKFVAENKVQPQISVYESNRGTAAISISLGLIILLLCFGVVLLIIYYFKHFILT